MSWAAGLLARRLLKQAVRRAAPGGVKTLAASGTKGAVRKAVAGLA